MFNPASFYYCYDGAGNLQMMLAEANNTFGETPNCWLDASNQRRPGRQSERSAGTAQRYTTPKRKRMHVSPFMGMGMRMQYDWIFTAPGERLVAHMNTIADGRAFFDATLQLERRAWSRQQLVRTLATYPFMTMRVIGGIHWALKLWVKGVPVFPHVAQGRASGRRSEE